MREILGKDDQPQAKKVKPGRLLHDGRAVASPDRVMHRSDQEIMGAGETESARVDTSPQWTVEAALQKFEQNYNDPRTKAQRWNGQERWQGKENEEMRLVRIMHPYQFMRRLRMAGVSVSIDTDRPGELKNTRVWLNGFVAKVLTSKGYVSSGRIGLNAWIYNPLVGEFVPETITTLQYPYGPEYSIMRFNEYDVPTNEKYRGWRTALLELIKKRIITEAEADRAFGKALTPASEFYREQLYEIRNRRVA